MCDGQTRLDMKLIDTHAHIYEESFAKDLEKVIERSIENSVQRILMPNLDSLSIEPMLDVEAKFPDICEPMVGLHPCYVKQDFKRHLYQMESWLGKRRFVGIGEIGLDLYWDKTYQKQQEEALSIQLEWAKQYDLPAVIHCRSGFNELTRILQKHASKQLKGVLHCFSGTLNEAKEITDLGFYLGIGGLLTFNNSKLLDVVKDIDSRFLVLETDSPYLTPVPYRNKRNEPSFILYIAEKLAEVKGKSIEEIAAITTKNANLLFS